MMSITTLALIRRAQLGITCATAAFAITPQARASDPSAFVSEILTPAGWQLHGHWCAKQDEPASSAELLIPEGWNRPSLREEPRWGGSGCSEVIVPPEWARIP
jgi:hypothetical protein